MVDRWRGRHKPVGIGLQLLYAGKKFRGRAPNAVALVHYDYVDNPGLFRRVHLFCLECRLLVLD